MSKPVTIAIDGLAASGKSTVAAHLAEQLDYFYFDTGVMYRAVTWAALNKKLDPADEAAVSDLAESLRIDVEADGPADGRQYTVRVAGQDVTWAIRQPQVDARVSQVSSYPRVRQALTTQQRRIAANSAAIVMVGRDIGTVVLPHADLKIFLQASAQERAHRRYLQAQAQNQSPNFEKILAGIIERDRQDQANPVSPTRPADDAILVNTDNLSLDEVVARLVDLVENRSNG